jgi:hypothetical protein
LIVSPATLDLGDIALELAAVRTATVSNAGDQAFAAPTVALRTGAAVEFSILQNGCQDSIDPGQSCTISTQFLPTVAGDFSGSLLIDAEAAGSVNVPLIATGLPPGDLIVAAADGASAQFGRVLFGESAESVLTILNPGASTSGPFSVSLNNPDFVVLVPGEGDCVPDVTNLSPGQSCTVRVSFTPTRREPSEAILTITSANGSSGLRLDGLGASPAVLVPLPDELELRALLGQSATASVTIENRGDEAATLNAPTVQADSANGAYTVVQNTCSALLPGGASCELALEFRPSALGPSTASLVIGAVGVEPIAVAVTGEALPPGALVVTALDAPTPPDALGVDFGAVRRNEERVLAFRLSNPGAVSSGALEQITASADFSVVMPLAGECSASTTLINGESCNLRVRFRPVQRGAHNGSLTVVSAGAGSAALPLRGTGTLPADIAAAPASVQLGDAILGESRSASVTLTNEGDEATSPPQMQISGIGSEAFGVSGCGAAIAALRSCELSVQFRPTADPAHTGLLTPSLVITSDVGGTANVSLTGRGLRPGSLEITPVTGSSTTFQAQVSGAQTQVFGITNTGGADSGAVTVSLTNPPGPRNFDLVSSGLATSCQTGQRLSAGSSCTVGVVFRPTQSGATLSATLTASSSGAGSDSIALTGSALGGPGQVCTRGADCQNGLQCFGVCMESCVLDESVLDECLLQ